MMAVVRLVELEAFDNEPIVRNRSRAAPQCHWPFLSGYPPVSVTRRWRERGGCRSGVADPADDSAGRKVATVWRLQDCRTDQCSRPAAPVSGPWHWPGRISPQPHPSFI